MEELIDAVSSALLRRLKLFASTIDVDPISIAQIRRVRKNTSVSIIGIIFDIRPTNKGHLILEIEDITGVCKVLVNKNSIYRAQAELLVKDMVVGVSGRMGEGIVFLNTLHMPSILTPKKMIKREVKILFVGADCDIPHLVKKHNITDVIYARQHLYKGGKGVNHHILAHGQVFPHIIDPIPGCLVIQNPCCIKIGGIFVSLCSQGLDVEHALTSGILTGAYGEVQMLPKHDEQFVLDPKTELLITHGHDFLERKEVGTICVSCDKDTFVVDMQTYKVMQI